MGEAKLANFPLPIWGSNVLYVTEFPKVNLQWEISVDMSKRTKELPMTVPEVSSMVWKKTKAAQLITRK